MTAQSANRTDGPGVFGGSCQFFPHGTAREGNSEILNPRPTVHIRVSLYRGLVYPGIPLALIPRGILRYPAATSLRIITSGIVAVGRYSYRTPYPAHVNTVFFGSQGYIPRGIFLQNAAGYEANFTVFSCQGYASRERGNTGGVQVVAPDLVIVAADTRYRSTEPNSSRRFPFISRGLIRRWANFSGWICR